MSVRLKGIYVGRNRGCCAREELSGVAEVEDIVGGMSYRFCYVVGGKMVLRGRIEDGMSDGKGVCLCVMVSVIPQTSVALLHTHLHHLHPLLVYESVQ